MNKAPQRNESEIVMKEVAAETKRIIASINDEQWLAYYHELVIYAERKCRRLYWKTDGPHALPGGNTPETVVREAIKRLFEGRRTWNHDRYPGENPVLFLKSLIDSLVSDLVRGEEHKRTAFLEDERKRTSSEGETYEVPLSAVADDIAGFRSTEPDNPEKEIFFREMLKRMHETIADRPDLVAYFGYSGDGYSPAEISVLMKLGIEKVYQLRKLLIARLTPLVEELLRKI